MKWHRKYSGICRVLVVATLAISAPAVFAAKSDKRLIILGVDGLDPNMLQRFVDEGVLPNFKLLMEQGDFKPLQTSMPPLSPTAWSTFITGLDPGGHGVFDFIHRDPETILPYLSMSKASEAEHTLKLGSWVIPLKGGKVEQLRYGTTFWEVLEDKNVPTAIYRVPANFPPVQTEGKALSGMGTPDILGTPGTFSYFTTMPPRDADEVTGGVVYEVDVINNKVDANLIGPKNSFRVEKSVGPDGEELAAHPDLKVPFTVYLDPEEAVAKIELQGQEVILKQGEWSEWVEVEFTAVPALAKVSSTARFYMQEVRPEFKLYVTPLQINPAKPAMPISSPEDWACDLCEELGYFYTKEMPEETKAHRHGIFSGREFWEQSTFVYFENRRMLDYALENFEKGLLFFYFSTIDQNCHMLWRYTDKDHPNFEEDEKLVEGIRVLYKEIDEALGRTMKEVDENTTIVLMSDHGFAPFYWGVNLNTWLLEKGYIALKDPSRQEKDMLFFNVDWSRTKAYAVGLNGVYVNLKGREKQGIVSESEYDQLIDQLEKDMLEFKDPRNGNNVITLAVKSRREFSGPHIDVGPDIVVGYNRGYRVSWESPLGEFPKDIIVDNDDAWSGDHANDYRLVPGVLLTNKKITLDSPSLYDLTVTVLDEFGVAPLPEMKGKDCIGE